MFVEWRLMSGDIRLQERYIFRILQLNYLYQLKAAPIDACVVVQKQHTFHQIFPSCLSIEVFSRCYIKS